MSINETIVHYIKCCDGSEKRVMQRTISRHRSAFRNQLEAEATVEKCILELLKFNYIEEVKLNDMNEIEKQLFLDDCCRVFRVVRKYNEDEFQKEKALLREVLDIRNSL